MEDLTLGFLSSSKFDNDAVIRGVWRWGRPRLVCYKVPMPRQSRIDAPGALHHVIIRGIERTLIFRNRNLGLTCPFLANELRISPSAVSKSMGRGRQGLQPDYIERLLESP